MARGAILVRRSLDLAQGLGLLHGLMAFGAQEVGRPFHTVFGLSPWPYVVLVVRVFELGDVFEIRPLSGAGLVALAAVVHVREIRERARVGPHAVTLKTGRMSFFDRQLAPAHGDRLDELMAIRAFRDLAGSNRNVRDARGLVGNALDLKVCR